MNDKIKKAFDKHYCDDFDLIKSKKVLSYYSYNDYYIKLLKGRGIFKTTLYMVQVLKEKDDKFIRQEKLNNQFHTENKAIDYIAELMTGGVDHAESG